MLVKKKTLECDVDMTPMIDVVFQLIIFFMVAISMAVVYGVVIKFPLGQAKKGANNSEKKERVISVFIEQDFIAPGHQVVQDGNMKILGQTVPMWVSGDLSTQKADRERAYKYIEEQMNYLITTKGFNKEKLVIKANPRTYQWKIIKILDIGQKLGLSKFSLSPPTVKQ